MSLEALAIKKEQTENYFIFHPDSVTVVVEGSGVSFPALYDNATFSNNRDGANVTQQKPVPHLTIFSGWESSVKRHDKVTFNGVTREVNAVKTDFTDSTFQAEIWLV